MFMVALLALIAGCKNSSTVQQNKSTDDQSLGFDKTEDMKDIYYRFPSPDEMLSIIDKSFLTDSGREEARKVLL